MHTVMLEHADENGTSWKWFVTIRRAQLRELHVRIKQYWLVQRFRKGISGLETLFNAEMGGGGGSGDHQHSPMWPVGGGGRGGVEGKEAEGRVRTVTDTLDVLNVDSEKLGLEMPPVRSTNSSSSTNAAAAAENDDDEDDVLYDAIKFPARLWADPRLGTDRESLKKRRKLVQRYLRQVVAVPLLWGCPALLELLEVSASTFDPMRGPSFCEGWVKARWSASYHSSRDRPAKDRLQVGAHTSIARTAGGHCHCCCCVCFCFRKKLRLRARKRVWCVVKHSVVSVYAGPKDVHAIAAFCFDAQTTVQENLVDTGIRNGILLTNSIWQFEIKFHNKLDHRLWAATLKDSLSRSPYVERDRFEFNMGSLRSEEETEGADAGTLTHRSQARWFVDAHDNYAAIYEAIEGAQRQVLIAGWWISPELYLVRRPAVAGEAGDAPGGGVVEESRLDRLLERKCQQGVDVFVLMMKEVTFAVSINSKHTVDTFNALDTRGHLHIMRHGDPSPPWYWSHHEKIVAVDQQCAFLGGLDLCFGRFDSRAHQLMDNGPVKLWPDKDYSNPRVKDFCELDKPGDLPEHDRANVPRMPWHDVHCCVRGAAAHDVCLYLINRWNFARFHLKLERTVCALVPFGLATLDFGLVPRDSDYDGEGASGDGRSRDDAGSGGLLKRNLVRPVTRAFRRMSVYFGDLGGREKRSAEARGSHARKDSADSVESDSDSVTRPHLSTVVDDDGSGDHDDKQNDPFGDGLLTTALSLMAAEKRPEQCSPFLAAARRRLCSEAHEAPAKELFHSIGDGEEGEQEEKKEEEKPRMSQGRSSSSSFRASTSSSTSLRRKSSSKSRGGGLLESSYSSDQHGAWTNCRISIVYSLGSWSGGLVVPKAAIHDAYIQLIESAQHFIYLENQFFVSGLAGDTRVENRIADALLARIKRAHDTQSKFRVIVAMPLLPAFEGKMQGGALSSFTAVMFWQYRSICHGGSSLLERLSAMDGIDPREYIRFYSLRTFSRTNDHEELAPRPTSLVAAAQKTTSKLVTEQVYIHSKCMVVDDRVAVIGSANINDRSMTGYRDSEICAVIEDTCMVESTMDGRPYAAGKFARSLRLNLFAEHLGLQGHEESIVDVVSDEVWDRIASTAKTNTAIFEHLFHCLPSDRFLSLKDIAASDGDSDGDSAQNKRNGSSGTVEGKDSSVGTASADDEEASTEINRGLRDLYQRRGSAYLRTAPGEGEGESKAGGDVPAEVKMDFIQARMSNKATGSAKAGEAAMLAQIQGHLVEFPLEFLAEDFAKLQPSMLPAALTL